MYVWSGSAWVSVATEVESLAGFATQSYADNAPGMKLVVPTSVAVGSGSGSVATQGTVSFSAASSVSINNCFSSTYKNYLIQFNLSGSTTNVDVDFRLRVSGTDNSSSNYNRSSIFQSSTTVSGQRLTAQAQWAGVAEAQSTLQNASEMQIFNPFETTYASALSRSSAATFGTITQSIRTYGIDVTTSYTGFTIYPASGTISGTLSVYGYKVG
jgi:hypothetical protein